MPPTMPKSYVQELTEVYEALLADALYAYPNMGSELLKDRARLVRLIAQRGLPFLLVDLPALGKHLDRCVAEGQYNSSGLPGSRQVSRTVVIPKMFRGLYLLVFNEAGRLREDIDVQAYFFLRQILYGAKKACGQCSDERTRREVAEFFNTDRCLPHPHPWWDADSVGEEEYQVVFPGFARETWYTSKAETSRKSEEEATPSLSAETCSNQILLVVLDKVVEHISSALGPYRFDRWDFKHGPGAVSDLRSGANRYWFANWSERLEHVFPIAECAYSNLGNWSASKRVRNSLPDELSDFQTATEPSSSLTAVPKTFMKPRLIASEPSEHMWCQQNVKHYMYTQVRNSWIGQFIKFDDQTLNQELCVRGSKDGSLVTLDLSAASDRVSCCCVGNMFRGNPSLLHALRSTRTRRLRQSFLEEEPDVVVVRKYSTMGNATTFPVESLIFLATALAAALVSEGHVNATPEEIQSLVGRVSVFGDDIVAPNSCSRPLIRLLEILDFKVNTSKSFLTGRFRESCGVDAYAGEVITPAYWHGVPEDKPESIASTLEVANNFYKKFLVNTSARIWSSVPAKYRNFPVVSMDSGVAGLQSFCAPTRAPLAKARWNAELQEEEFLLLTFSGSKIEKREIGNDTALLQFHTEYVHTEQPYVGLGRLIGRLTPNENWESGVATERPSLKIKRRWVPSHLLSNQYVITRTPGRTVDGPDQWLRTDRRGV